MKTSFVATVLNEEDSIERLLESILSQTTLPSEVVIVDGGSQDNTVSLLKSFKKKFQKKKIELLLFTKKGNRSKGRNYAIEKANYEFILIADAGCILDRSWISEIIKPFEKNKTDVVAGYYKGLAKTTFQKCLIPYFLVMPDRLNPKEFLPATRSMAIKKSIWKKVKGFDENLSHNEDYEFAKRLQRENTTMNFSKKAIVYWMPPKSYRDAYRTFYRYSYGDIEAGIIRPKVVLVLTRYIIYTILIGISLYTKNTSMITVTALLTIVYILWAIKKNYKYSRNMISLIQFPMIQLLSDAAIIHGSLKGANSIR